MIIEVGTAAILRSGCFRDRKASELARSGGCSDFPASSVGAKNLEAGRLPKRATKKKSGN